MDAYVINLSTRKDRWAKINEELSDTFRLNRREGCIESVEHLGCTLAHIKIAKEAFSNTETQWCLVFEDDAYVQSKEKLTSLIKNALEYINTWDMVVFSATLLQDLCNIDKLDVVNYLPKTIKKTPSPFFIEVGPSDNIVSSAAVLYSRSSLPLLNSYEDKIQLFREQNLAVPIDRFLFTDRWFGKYKWNKPRVWISHELLVKQHDGYSDIRKQNIYHNLKNTQKFLDAALEKATDYEPAEFRSLDFRRA
jgi:GR25 family glycosyltransferase involved in LPS biosynthesis